MGTSGAYGGSGKQSWDDVRDLLDALPATGGDGADSGGDGDPLGDDGLSDLAGALADALSGDDPTIARPQQDHLPLASLLSRRPARGSGGGGGGAGGVRGETSTSGRVGAGSRRSVGRAAARGGAAVGGAYALRSGDRAGLAELGLDLDELRGLGPRSQCARILDAVLGDSGHPDEAALKAAAAEQLKAIILEATPPSEADALRGFIAAFVFQLALVEIRAEISKGRIDAPTATKKEARLRRYIDRRVSSLQVASDGRWRPSDFSTHSQGLAQEAIALLRAR